MSNVPIPTSPIVSIHLGGKDWQLRYDFNALIRLEKEIGKSAFDATTFQAIRAQDLRAFIWAGLLHQQHDLTLEEVGSWINPQNMKLVAEAIGKAFSTGEGNKVPLAEGVQETSA